MIKQYAERNAYELDVAGNYYSTHISAMTREALHSKSDIAAELAHRDMLIDQLKAQVEQLRDALSRQLNDCINFDGSKLTDAVMAESSRTLKNTPNQCLAEVRAQAGRDGYIEGANDWSVPEFVNCKDLLNAAEQYGNKLRQAIKDGE